MEINDIYKCEVCGNIVVVADVGGGELTCCGQKMTKLTPEIKEEGGAKHIPVITKVEDGINVKLGEVPHPMEEDHYIKFIILTDGEQIYRANLKPGDAPEATFKVTGDAADFKACAYCNKHGLWPSA